MNNPTSLRVGEACPVCRQRRDSQAVDDGRVGCTDCTNRYGPVLVALLSKRGERHYRLWLREKEDPYVVGPGYLSVAGDWLECDVEGWQVRLSDVCAVEIDETFDDYEGDDEACGDDVLAVVIGGDQTWQA